MGHGMNTRRAPFTPSVPRPLDAVPGGWVEHMPARLQPYLRLARLDRPAYLYLFWIGSEGKVAPLYPWREHDWTNRPTVERKVTGAEIPEVMNEVLEMPSSPPGLEALLLLAKEGQAIEQMAHAGAPWAMGAVAVRPRSTSCSRPPLRV